MIERVFGPYPRVDGVGYVIDFKELVNANISVRIWNETNQDFTDIETKNINLYLKGYQIIVIYEGMSVYDSLRLQASKIYDKTTTYSDGTKKVRTYAVIYVETGLEYETADKRFRFSSSGSTTIRAPYPNKVALEFWLKTVTYDKNGNIVNEEYTQKLPTPWDYPKIITTPSTMYGYFWEFPVKAYSVDCYGNNSYTEVGTVSLKSANNLIGQETTVEFNGKQYTIVPTSATSPAINLDEEYKDPNNTYPNLRYNYKFVIKDLLDNVIDEIETTPNETTDLIVPAHTIEVDLPHFPKQTFYIQDATLNKNYCITQNISKFELTIPHKTNQLNTEVAHRHVKDININSDVTFEFKHANSLKSARLIYYGQRYTYEFPIHKFELSEDDLKVTSAYKAPILLIGEVNYVRDGKDAYVTDIDTQANILNEYEVIMTVPLEYELPTEKKVVLAPVNINKDIQMYTDKEPDMPYIDITEWLKKRNLMFDYAVIVPNLIEIAPSELDLVKVHNTKLIYKDGFYYPEFSRAKLYVMYKSYPLRNSMIYRQPFMISEPKQIKQFFGLITPKNPLAYAANYILSKTNQPILVWGLLDQTADDIYNTLENLKGLEYAYILKDGSEPLIHNLLDKYININNKPYTLVVSSSNENVINKYNSDSIVYLIGMHKDGYNYLLGCDYIIEGKNSLKEVVAMDKMSNLSDYRTAINLSNQGFICKYNDEILNPSTLNMKNGLKLEREKRLFNKIANELYQIPNKVYTIDEYIYTLKQILDNYKSQKLIYDYSINVLEKVQLEYTVVVSIKFNLLREARVVLRGGLVG